MTSSNPYAKRLRELAERYDLMAPADRAWLYQASGYIEGLEQGAELLKDALKPKGGTDGTD